MDFRENCFENESGEMDEAALDEILFGMAEMIEEQERKTAMLVPSKLRQIRAAYDALSKMVCGRRGVQIYCTLHEPFKSMGCITVSGKSLSFYNAEEFIKAAESASVFEAFAKTDGTVEIEFTFHGLTIPLE